MRITITCLAILLLAAFATARLGDVAGVTTTSSVATPTTTTPSDVDNFQAGVWDAIGLGHEFEDFAACIKEADNADTQLQKAMTLMNSSSASDVTRGLKNLAKVVSPLVAGLKACNMKDKYMSTVNKIVKFFTDPDSLSIKKGVSITINDVDVYSKIAAAITACDKDDFFTCGSAIGGAMGKVFYSQANVSTADQAAQINAIPNISWTAGVNADFKGMTVWQFKKSRITLRRKNDAESNSTNSTEEEDTSRRNLATVPTAFDSRTTWPKCIGAIRNQGGCGDCWALAASEALADRFCIASNQSINKVMSPQYLVSCDTTSYGCSGGIPYKSWKFLESTGDTSDTCTPYKSSNGVVPACSTLGKCTDGSTMRKYYAKVNSTKYSYGAAAIQTEIMTNGPVEAGMDVYSDFMSYVSGIYATTAGSTYLGGHAIKIIGWGNTGGVNYWIVANSWGTTWGEAGFFRIKFGSCYIDSGSVSGLPDLTRS
jgi:cathepsin B